MRRMTGVLAVAVFAGASPSWADGSDELWEMTTSVAMDGMSMPPSKSTLCIPKGDSYRPESDRADKNCKVTDSKVAGDTVSWKVVCTGKDAMTGNGQMTKSASTMKGLIKMTTADGAMTQTLDGKRVGSCTATKDKPAAASAKDPKGR